MDTENKDLYSHGLSAVYRELASLAAGSSMLGGISGGWVLLPQFAEEIAAQTTSG